MAPATPDPRPPRFTFHDGPCPAAAGGLCTHPLYCDSQTCVVERGRGRPRGMKRGDARKR